MQKFKGLLKRLCLSALVLFACLGLAEVGVRLFSNVGPGLLIRDRVVGKKYQPGFAGDVFIPEAGRDIHLRFNEHGFRGVDLPAKRPAGHRRVAVLGDSYVVAVAVQEEQTAVRELESLLNDSHPEVRWEVQNFGVSSSSTALQLVLFRELVAARRPDLVVCAFAIRNDFVDNSPHLSRVPGGVYFDVETDGRLVRRPSSSAAATGLSVWLNQKSRLYVWQREKVQRITSSARKAAKAPKMEDLVFHDDPTGGLEDTWELTAGLIEALRDEVESSGGRFVLALFPRAEQVDPEEWRELLELTGDKAAEFDQELPVRRLSTIARERGIPVVPMAGDFREGHERHGSLFFGGDGHYNEEGNRLAALTLHRFLTEGEGRGILQAVIDASPPADE